MSSTIEQKKKQWFSDLCCILAGFAFGVCIKAAFIAGYEKGIADGGKAAVKQAVEHREVSSDKKKESY